MNEVRSRWFSRRAIALHAVILVVIPTFTALCIWQVSRALGGNELSWAYVFEWPFFGGYATYMWWRFVHEDPEARRGNGAVPTGAGASASTETTEPGTPPSPDDAELIAYNAYLAELAARDKPKQWR